MMMAQDLEKWRLQFEYSQLIESEETSEFSLITEVKIIRSN